MPKVSCLEVLEGGVIERKKELWQPSCRNCRGEKKKLMGIVAAKLPKLEKRGERKIDLWQ